MSSVFLKTINLKRPNDSAKVLNYRKGKVMLFVAGKVVSEEGVVVGCAQKFPTMVRGWERTLGIDDP